MKNKFVFIMLLTLFFRVDLQAGGISVDAGLTPPQDRFILRIQYRFMSMENTMMTMNTKMIPVVFAYGVTSRFTVMTKGMYVYQKIENTAEVNNGINDLFLLLKFRLYRLNTANYVFGVAPHISTNIPMGSMKISNRSWNPELGLNISFRPRFFAIDVSTYYVLSDISGKLATKPGNFYNMNTAISALIPLKNNTSNVISPVLEMTYTTQEKSEANPLNNILFISPGISFIHSSLALEALIQIPVFQTENTSIMNQSLRSILGVKYMF